jgi:heat shock protein 1/8
MSIIGIDLGSHAASIAVWYDDKNLLEVLADDLGFRTIPCVVAFRGEETIVGHSAVSQAHKNTANTFDEVRSLLFNKDQSHANVPVLERDLTVEEINSIFFRNIHNQVKQQAGRIIREAVVTVPTPLSEETKKRYMDAAQHGGIRIKSFIEDSTAALLAYGLDDTSSSSDTAVHASKVVVLDLGWSRCTVSLYVVSNGAIVPIASQSTSEVTGKIFVKLLADFCAKEFTRKHKVPVHENKRSMMRLFRECELAMKSLSTGSEATIDIDSLCEGIDYSTKITRARFEDLISIPFVHFKNLISSLLSTSGYEGSSINYICLSGGPSSIPKIINTLKGAFPNGVFPKVRFETSEAPAIGAAVHGKHLFELVRFLSCHLFDFFIIFFS